MAHEPLAADLALGRISGGVGSVFYLLPTPFFLVSLYLKERKMWGIFAIIQTFMWCITILGMTIVVALAIPASELRKFMLPIVGRAIAVWCAANRSSQLEEAAATDKQQPKS